MKKILLPILLIFSIILITQVFGYNNEKVGDTSCVDIKKETRYPNLSPILIGKIDLIGDKLNNKYNQKDEIYKDKIYELYIKLLNENIVKTKYSERQKEILLRIGDYFVCKKEELSNLEFVEEVFNGVEVDEETNNTTNNSTNTQTEISNIKISNITDHSIKVTWEGNSEAITWLQIKNTGAIGGKNNGTNNEFEYKTLGSGYEFTLFLQGKGESKIHKIDFKTIAKNSTTNINETEYSNTDNSITETTVSSSNNSKVNKYLEEVNIPVYNKNNPEHFLIDSVSKFNSTNLNNINYKHFYIKPGDYSKQGRIVIKTSGNKDKRRTLSLLNDNDLHPGKIDEDKLANVALKLDGASYWTFDRLSFLTAGYTSIASEAGSILLSNKSTNNIFNRLYFHNHFWAINIRGECHNNTIQNSYFNDIHPRGRVLDISTITLMDWGLHHTKNTKIINNEFRNFKAIKLHDDPTGYGDKMTPSDGNNPYFNGTIIDSNIIWFDDDVRTDGDGTPNPNGDYAAIETVGVGIKSGSDNENEPVIISNNINWGGWPTHRGEGTVLSSPAAGFSTAYMGSKYIHYIGNMLFDMDSGITIADRYDQKRGTWGALLEDNIFYNLGKRPQSRDGGAMLLSQAEDMVVKNNLVKDVRDEWSRVYYNYYNNYFGKNDVVNMQEPLLYKGNHSHVDGVYPTDTNNYYTESEANKIYVNDYTFKYMKFTNTPKIKTIKNVLKEDQDPYLNIK